METDRRWSAEHRIVVTGVGMVTPLGTGKDAFAEKLFAGASGIQSIQGFDTRAVPSHLGAEVRDFSPRDFISVKNLRRMDKTSLMAAASARLALEDAQIAVTTENRDRIGILLGTAFGSTDITLQFANALIGEGPSSVNPIIVPNTVMNAPAGHASIELGFRGVNTTVTHFAVSAETAIAYAAFELRRGVADVMLAGGVDILSKFYYEVLSKFRGLSPDDGKKEEARPFDVERNGYIVGEGAGILCLETLARALDRGAKIYCEILGVGLGSSPETPTGWPHRPDGAVGALNRALADAGIPAHAIQAVMAAANGSRRLDEVEALAYQNVFASSSEKPWLTSIKGALGESFSGGGIRACALALSMEKECLPPTVGLVKPLASMKAVMGSAFEGPIGYAVLAGISFGGTYAYLVFGRGKMKEGEF